MPSTNTHWDVRTLASRVRGGSALPWVTFTYLSIVGVLLTWHAAPAAACSGSPCAGAGDLELVGDMSKVVGGVIQATCRFCEESELPDVAATPATGGDPVEGTWQRYASHDLVHARLHDWVWRPAAELAPGVYHLSGLSLCDASTFESYTPETMTVIAANGDDEESLAPAFRLGWATRPAGSRHPCDWYHGNHCGRETLPTRSVRVPAVVAGLPALEDGPVSALRVRLRGEGEAGPVHGAWVAPERLRGEPTRELLGHDYLTHEVLDTGVYFEGDQREYCVSLEVLDLTSGDISEHGRTCLPGEDLPLGDERPWIFWGCDEYLDDAPIEAYRAVYCQDNASDCCGQDSEACVDFHAECDAQGLCDDHEPVVGEETPEVSTEDMHDGMTKRAATRRTRAMTTSARPTKPPPTTAPRTMTPPTRRTHRMGTARTPTRQPGTVAAAWSDR